jgi:hypothetical protein
VASGVIAAQLYVNKQHSSQNPPSPTSPSSSSCIHLDLSRILSLFSLHGITYASLILSRSSPARTSLKLYGLVELCGEGPWYSTMSALASCNLALSPDAARSRCGWPSTILAGRVIEMASVPGTRTTSCLSSSSCRSRPCLNGSSGCW